MHKLSQQKLLDADFVFLDARVSASGKNHQIWQKTKQRHSWHILEKGIATKAELKRRMWRLLKLHNTIDLYDSLHQI